VILEAFSSPNNGPWLGRRQWALWLWYVFGAMQSNVSMAACPTYACLLEAVLQRQS